MLINHNKTHTKLIVQQGIQETPEEKDEFAYLHKTLWYSY